MARVQLTLVLQAVSGIRLREPVQDVVRGWLYIEAPLIGNGSVYSCECQLNHKQYSCIRTTRISVARVQLNHKRITNVGVYNFVCHKQALTVAATQ